MLCLVGMFSIQSPGDNISVALRKLLQGGRRGEFATKGAGSLNIKDQVSRNLMQASGLTKFILCRCTSAIWGQFCLLVHLAFCVPPVPQESLLEGGSSISFGSPHSHLEARNHWWLWHFLFINNGRRHFHSTDCVNIQYLLFWCHSVWWSLGPSTSPQMNQFCSLLWLSNRRNSLLNLRSTGPGNLDFEIGWGKLCFFQPWHSGSKSLHACLIFSSKKGLDSLATGSTKFETWRP